MITISSALKNIISNNPILQFGLRKRIFNLSQLARMLVPQVAARSKKEVSESALLMALSRLQGAMPKRDSDLSELKISIDNINITSNLCALSFANTVEVHRGLNAIYTKILKRGGFMTITHGIREIRVIVDRSELEDLKASLRERPLMVHTNLASLGVSFRKNYLNTPGFFFFFFQQLYFQNVNIIEIASTANELLIYVDEKDVRLGVDTLLGGR